MNSISRPRRTVPRRNKARQQQQWADKNRLFIRGAINTDRLFDINILF
jgi:hypothetical protein